MIQLLPKFLDSYTMCFFTYGSRNVCLVVCTYTIVSQKLLKTLQTCHKTQIIKYIFRRCSNHKSSTPSPTSVTTAPIHYSNIVNCASVVIYIASPPLRRADDKSEFLLLSNSFLKAGVGDGRGFVAGCRAILVVISLSLIRCLKHYEN